MQMTGAITERNLTRHFDSIKANGTGYVKAVASVVTLHGTEAQDAALNLFRDSPFCQPERDLGIAEPFSAVVHPQGSSVRVDHSSHKANGYEHSGALFSNSQTILPILQRVNSKATELFRAGAYLHQYEAHGITKDDFKHSFLEVGQVIQDYRSL